MRSLSVLVLIIILALVGVFLARGLSEFRSEPEVWTPQGRMGISEIESELVEGFSSLIGWGGGWESNDDALNQVVNACLADISDVKGQSAVLIDQACDAFGEGDFHTARQFALEATHH